ncbi:hypothetical protein JOM56_006750 [Amanita muscaria]
MSTFRVSPWVSYNAHLSNIAGATMDEDVDMDAPQISILRDEDSPPPQRKAASRKQKASPKKAAPEFPYLPRPRKDNLSDEEYDEPEEEEDQLIDDDDEKPAQTPVSASGRSAEAGQKRKVPSKRKPRKTDKKADEEKKGKEKQNQQSVPPMTVEPSETEPPPLETMGDTITVDPALNNVPQNALPVIVEPGTGLKPPAPSKKKAAPRKPPAAPRQRAKITNDNEKLKITIPPMLPPEDIEAASEGGHTGTAASSPIVTRIELIEPPELEFDLPAPLAPLPLQDETSLDNVPIPIYPLPTKPFSVQPAPKLNTGAAPIIPLDKSGTKVRHWRMANREIRGIAGGRWFARTWVGEKESDFAAAMAAAGKEADEKVPKGSSISAPVGKGSAKTKGSKNVSLAASASGSAAPSRDGSLAPDLPLSISAVRNPTKMRITLGPEEYAD